jgi:GNAT superfamily N-acetyltransferase
MNPDVTVHSAGRDDREPVVSLIERQFREHSIDTDRTALEEAVAAVLADEKLGVFLLARIGGQTVGIAYISFIWSLEHCGRSAWLDELYVVPDERNRGVGRALLQAAYHVSRRHGCAAIDLEVEKAHSRAENLYRREGFLRLSRTRWVRKLDSSER